MTDRPILFSGPMVRALLEGRKAQTRRVLKPQPLADGYYDGQIDCTFVPARDARDTACFRFGASAVGGGAIRTEIYQPPYAQGDRLWVREGFSGPYGCRNLPPRDWPNAGPIWHWADGNPEHGNWTRPKPGIHMPRWASRLTLTVTDVRVQRLQDISEDDARAEGVEPYMPTCPDDDTPAADAFMDLWDSLNAHRAPWNSNPWVVALTFTVRRGNIDRVGLTDRQLRDQIAGQRA